MKENFYERWTSWMMVGSREKNYVVCLLVLKEPRFLDLVDLAILLLSKFSLEAFCSFALPFSFLPLTFPSNYTCIFLLFLITLAIF